MNDLNMSVKRWVLWLITNPVITITKFSTQQGSVWLWDQYMCQILRWRGQFNQHFFFVANLMRYNWCYHGIFIKNICFNSYNSTNFKPCLMAYNAMRNIDPTTTLTINVRELLPQVSAHHQKWKMMCLTQYMREAVDTLLAAYESRQKIKWLKTSKNLIAI